MTNEESLLEIAKLYYPVGTVYKCAANNYEFTVNEQYFSVISDDTIWGEDLKGCLLYNGKWAEIISKPETEWVPKVGEWVVKTNGTCHDNVVIGEAKRISSISDNFINHFTFSDTTHRYSHNPKNFRPALPNEIPQQEEKVEHWECLEYYICSSNTNYKKGIIYPTRTDRSTRRIGLGGVAVGSHTCGKVFKPSTKEAYEAQERGEALGFCQQKEKEAAELISNQVNQLNNVSQINQKQNEHSKEDSQIKKNLDTDTGAKAGQSIRLRTASIRIECESGSLPSGKEIARSRKGSPRIKAEIGKRFI